MPDPVKYKVTIPPGLKIRTKVTVKTDMGVGFEGGGNKAVLDQTPKDKLVDEAIPGPRYDNSKSGNPMAIENLSKADTVKFEPFVKNGVKIEKM